MTRKDFEDLVFEKYKVRADYPFEDDNVSGVFRQTDNGKWFAIAMNVPSDRITGDHLGRLDIVNLKCPPQIVESLAETEHGVFRAYHMNKIHWVSVVLDAAADDLTEWLLDISYTLTGKNAKKIKDI